MKLSELHRRVVIDATIQPLYAFRRGFARTKMGPFYELRTIHYLVERGILRAYFPPNGRRGIKVTARATW